MEFFTFWLGGFLVTGSVILLFGATLRAALPLLAHRREMYALETQRLLQTQERALPAPVIEALPEPLELLPPPSELSPMRYSDVLAVAGWVQDQIARGNETPFSVRNLQGGPLLIGDSGRQFSIGSITDTAAREFPQALAELGCIQGRERGIAGTWVPKNTDDAKLLISKNWKQYLSKKSYPAT